MFVCYYPIDKKNIVKLGAFIQKSLTSQSALHSLNKLAQGAWVFVIKYKEKGVLPYEYSFWKNVPYSYSDFKSNGNTAELLTNESFPPTCHQPGDVLTSEILRIYQFIKLLSTTNKTKNGKDQDQLQGEANPDSGCYEGSVLYRRRNGSQFAAGRHCDQEGTEVKRTRTRGGKIYLSSRRPEIYGTKG